MVKHSKFRYVTGRARWIPSSFTVTVVNGGSRPLPPAYSTRPLCYGVAVEELIRRLLEGRKHDKAAGKTKV
jgi:hypothetical protein